MEAKRRLFQTLKAPCVQCSETAVNVSTGRTPAVELVPDLERLHHVLQSLTASGRPDAQHFDAKLAEYVFYPLSLVFRQREVVPFRALETGLQCLRCLLITGWRDIDTPQLATQLLILLTFLADTKLLGKRNDVAPEELRSHALECISELFLATARVPSTRDAILETQNVPALGHTITVMIESCKNGISLALQLSALRALNSFVDAVPDRDVLASFFPGIVSALSQILQVSTKVRRNYQVYVAGLGLLQRVISLVLSDKQLAGADVDTLATTATSNTKSAAWLKATQGQLKVAIAPILKLRIHDRAEVRLALRGLCWTVLVDCEKNLPECSQMMLETCIVISITDDDAKSMQPLDDLLATNSNIAEMLRSSLYDWLVAMPRLMLSNDETSKQRIILQIRSSYSMLLKSDLDMSIIDSMLLTTLSDSLLNVTSVSSLSTTVAEKPLQLTISSEPASGSSTTSQSFTQILVKQDKSMETVKDLRALIETVSRSRSCHTFVRGALTNARYGQLEARTAGVYIALQVLKARHTEDAEFDNLLDLDIVNDSDSSLHEELYGFAVSLLTDLDETDSLDWRMRALALEAVALQAQRLKTSFRIELVDVLYPVVQLMGSSLQPLQEHSMVCMNIIATACGYEHARDLLVSNVDYLVNAIGAKLNAFDISPEAPQVLLMMVRICGPTLLPYLDDLVDSIFEALECFHGYPSLVELLFAVLRVIVEEGAKAPQFTIAMKEHVSHRRMDARPTSVAAVVEAIAQRHAKSSVPLATELEGLQDDLPKDTPQEPWKNLRKDKNEDDTAAPPSSQDIPAFPPSSTDDEAPPPPPETEPRAPLSRHYTTLNRITLLTQHHLPSSSSSLRTSLLSLLTTSLPYLSHHDDSFLPLVHALWPILIPRLADREAYVVAGTLDVLGEVCVGAGDFVGARVEEIWGGLGGLWRRLERERVEGSGGGGEGRVRGSGRGMVGRGKMMERIEAGGIRTSPLSSESGSSLITLTSTARDDLLTASSPSSRTLTTTLPIHPPQPQPQPRSQPQPQPQTPYIASTTHLLSRSLSRFLVKLITHVRITQKMKQDVLYEMLWGDLVREVEGWRNATGKGKRAGKVEGVEAGEGGGGRGGGGGGERGETTVREALEGLGADAVWLALGRAGLGEKMEKAEAKGMGGWGENMRMPVAVAGGVPWVKVA